MKYHQQLSINKVNILPEYCIASCNEVSPEQILSFLTEIGKSDIITSKFLKLTSSTSIGSRAYLFDGHYFQSIILYLQAQGKEKYHDTMNSHK